MMINIEFLKQNEVSEFCQVFNKLLIADFPGYSKKVIDFLLNKVYTPQAFAYWLTIGWRPVILAKVNNKIVGFAVMDKPYGGVAFLRWLGVLKEFRHQGVGKHLIQSVVVYAKDYGCHKLEVAAQTQASEFYRKVGLELEGKRRLSYFGIDHFIYGKILGVPKDEVMIKE